MGLDKAVCGRETNNEILLTVSPEAALIIQQPLIFSGTKDREAEGDP